MIVDSDNLHKALKHFYGYDEFRKGQEEIVSEILQGRPVLAVLPTGAGKSVCFQLPSLVIKGMTLVISPLISLMKDQVENLKKRGITAAYLESGMSSSEYGKVLNDCLNGDCKFLYVSPERLASEQFVDFAKKAYITLVAVDEAHCVSQWGRSFRKDYYNIPDFIAKLTNPPLLTAFTASATPKVREDILKRLNIEGAKIVVTGFDRPNLTFCVRNSYDKNRDTLNYVESHKKDYGIIYCSTRKNVEAVTELLQSKGYSALRYHAGLTAEERKVNQQRFVEGKVKIIVATNAFGMGIDKADVRYVLHYNMSKDVEGYYQEAGRAGRDGKPSECILLFERKDMDIIRYLIENGDASEEVVQYELMLLESMKNYCYSDNCLRRYILNYFGEPMKKNCGNCSNCIRRKTVILAPKPTPRTPVKQETSTRRKTNLDFSAAALSRKQKEKKHTLGIDWLEGLIGKDRKH